MSRYIDADEFMNKFVDKFWSTDISFSSVDDIVEKLVKKAGDVAPVIHAEWKYNGANYKCTNCGNTDRYGDSLYCPKCGAKMDANKKEIEEE